MAKTAISAFCFILIHFFHLYGYWSCLSAFISSTCFFLFTSCILLYLFFLPLYFLIFQFYFLVDVLYFSFLPALYLVFFPSSPSLFARFSPTAFPSQAHPTSLVSGAADSNKTQPPLTWCPRISQLQDALEKMFSYTLVISLP